MNSKIFLIRLVILIFIIFLLNLLAMKFYWYSSIWYLDVLMHFFGGFWLGLVAVWLLNIKEIYLRSILKIVLSVLFIGIFWEIFEIIIDKSITGNIFNTLDTISDICFDFSGGLFAILYFSRKIISFKETAT